MRGLTGGTILLTGVTGFLGTALLEKLLRGVPECTVIALIRPGRLGAERRLGDVLAGSAFDGLRDRWGDGFAATVRSRVVPLAGDLARPGLGLDEAGMRRVASVGAVIHSAAEVAFDSPLDVALATNVGGPVRLLETLRAAGAAPVVVQLSTAYVSGMRSGLVLEGTPGGLASDGGPALDWRAELEAALTVRAGIEAESRGPRRMRGLAAEARRGRGASGVPAGGAETERLRARWVVDRLVEHGRQHARALGWSDVYTLSKSLAELAVAELCDDLPLSIVRPSIIESSLAEPRPGWINGLRMAEPVVLAYGRGLLPEFPGLPDGVVDIVPVDVVTNAVLAAAAHPPPPGVARVMHVCTGARNPLTYRGLFENVRDHFRAHPLLDGAGAVIDVPDWRFPSQRRESRRLGALEAALSVALRFVELAPATPRTRAMAERFEDSHQRVRRARSLAELYASYTHMDAVFDDSTTVALDRGRPAEERAAFPFDAAALDWEHYLQRIHFPAVVELARLRRRSPRPLLPRATATAAPRHTVGRLHPLRPPAPAALAVFDVEGTVADLTVVQHYIFFLLDARPRRQWPRTLAETALRVPGWVRLDRRSRLDFQRRFYRGYAGLEQERVVEAAQRALDEITLPRCYPHALRRIREHRDAGHRVVLVTGALDEVVRPLAELLEVEVRAARLRTSDGVFTGDLAETPPSSEARGALVRRLAEQTGAPLDDCHAYADSVSDLSMLEAVGHPVPVNPDLRLAALARRRGWPAQSWSVRDGGGRWPVVTPAAARPPVGVR